MRLNHAFFNRPTLSVAKDLLGKVLVHQTPDGNIEAIISETEAYTEDDPASHAYLGRKTKRNETMFRRAGHMYIYLIYGVHHCANVVTEEEHKGCAVLLRGAYPLSDGPGKLCKAFQLNERHNGADLVAKASPIFIEDRGLSPTDIIATPRIGISKAKDRHWRFLSARFVTL